MRRKRTRLHVPIWTSVVLFTINIGLLVSFIVLLWRQYVISALTIGIIAISLGLLGLTFYLILTIKEISLNHRQSNFIDSVTHELKTPLAALRLYLETLEMRELDDAQRKNCYEVMGTELRRLDQLINQLLEVARLDAVGQDSEPEDIPLEPLLRRCAESAAAHHKVEIDEVFEFDCEPARIHSRQLMLEMIFGNLVDNAVKYAGDPPRVRVEVRNVDRGRVITRVIDNGLGVPAKLRRKVFQMFYRSQDELHRSKKGTGLGLYIVRTLVHLLKGKVSVHDRADQPGSVFEVELAGEPPT